MSGPASPPALELRAVERAFSRGLLRRARPVLLGVDLELAPGEALGLVGPNGSGKSTLLRIAAGVERPSAGVVRIFGASPEDPGARRRIGWLSDGSPFPGELSPRAVLDLLASLHGLARRERRAAVEELLTRVGLLPEASRALGRFSQGMLRRFGLATAFLHRPDLVLLDEPTAGLDAEGHGVLEELLGEARARGAALLLATHVVSDLQDHCERACVLVGGKLAASGRTVELLGDRRKLLDLYRSAAGPGLAEEARSPRGRDRARLVE